jgi:hypothetical protein
VVSPPPCPPTYPDPTPHDRCVDMRRAMCCSLPPPSRDALVSIQANAVHELLGQPLGKQDTVLFDGTLAQRLLGALAQCPRVVDALNSPSEAHRRLLLPACAHVLKWLLQSTAMPGAGPWQRHVELWLAVTGP